MRAVRWKFKCATLTLAALVGACSDGGGGSGFTSVTTTVIDGAIRNALVCLDKNRNSECEGDEPQGRTLANGSVTLLVADADVGKFPIIAMVRPDSTPGAGDGAVDADNGKVLVAYTLSAPADRVSVVSPLTTLVQQIVASTGASTDAAASTVREATGISVLPFDDFTKTAAPTDGSLSAATVARMLVLTAQEQSVRITSALNTQTIAGDPIKQSDLDKAVQIKLLELLPTLVAALSDPALSVPAKTPEEIDARNIALAAAADTVLNQSGLTPTSVATAVAINNQTPSTTPVTPVAGFSLANLNFTNASNFYMRVFSGTLAQNTPDASGNFKFVDRRYRSTSGSLAQWGTGSDPARQADLHWNGTAWVNCPLNFENISSVRDAQGNSTYEYCDKLETGKTSRATFGIGDKPMAEVYAQIQAAGMTNLTIADTSVLGTATFPTGSSLFYQTTTPLTNAIAYYPGKSTPAGVSNVVTQYSDAISAGGTAGNQTAGTGCNSAETSTIGVNSTTLEGLISARSGTPCVYSQGSFVYSGTTYTSDVPNEWWGNSTLGIGTLGTVALNTGAAPGYYSGNTKLRIAFKGSGTNPVTYYACKERFTDGSSRNCLPIGTGSYAIATLGDARVLTLTNLPAQASSLNYKQVFVERGGLVYAGYQSKPNVNNTARLNTVAATALLTQLGLPAVNPEVPLALTAGSYQGVWDARDPAITDGNETVVSIRADASVSCQDTPTSIPRPCTITFTNPSTGAFTLTNGGLTAVGTFDFLTGTGSGTYSDPTSTPATGNFVARRR